MWISKLCPWGVLLKFQRRAISALFSPLVLYACIMTRDAHTHTFSCLPFCLWSPESYYTQRSSVLTTRWGLGRGRRVCASRGRLAGLDPGELGSCCGIHVALPWVNPVCVCVCVCVCTHLVSKGFVARSRLNEGLLQRRFPRQPVLWMRRLYADWMGFKNKEGERNVTYSSAQHLWQSSPSCWTEA